MDSLGWEIEKVEGRVLQETYSRRIIKAEEIRYCLRLPILSKQEHKVISEVLEEIRDSQGKSRKAVYAILKNYLFRQQIFADKEQEKYLSKILELEVFDFGPLSEILQDKELEEISVIGIEKAVYVFHRDIGWIKTNFYFTDEETIKAVVNKMARHVEKRLSFQFPKLNAVLPNGSRLNSCTQPISFSGTNITIRKFNSKRIKAKDLIYLKTISAEAIAFLSMALETDVNLLICGNTGSGKTTTLNALFEFVPKQERIIITEETPEIDLSHEHVVRLKTDDNLGIGMRELIVNTLRMRPDRVVVGEIRNKEEVEAFIDTVLAGQGKGSYATFHAVSANEAITRMKKLGVLEMDLAALDLVLVQKRWNKIDLEKGIRKEIRKIVEVCEIVHENEKVSLNCLWKYNYGEDKLEKINESIKVIEKIKNSFSLSKEKVKEELNKRENELTNLEK